MKFIMHAQITNYTILSWQLVSISKLFDALCIKNYSNQDINWSSQFECSLICFKIYIFTIFCMCHANLFYYIIIIVDNIYFMWLFFPGCNTSMQCLNGICMHPNWICNGINECGDYSDEQKCAPVPIHPEEKTTGCKLLKLFLIVQINYE